MTHLNHFGLASFHCEDDVVAELVRGPGGRLDADAR